MVATVLGAVGVSPEAVRQGIMVVRALDQASRAAGAIAAGVRAPREAPNPSVSPEALRIMEALMRAGKAPSPPVPEAPAPEDVADLEEVMRADQRAAKARARERESQSQKPIKVKVQVVRDGGPAEIVEAELVEAPARR